MRYFLDAEFNGFQGELISIALVPEDDHLEAFYAALDCKTPTPWVREYVLPVLHAEPATRREVTARLAAYLKGDGQPFVVADWPEDIAHLVLLMVTGPGSRLPMPTVRFGLMDLPLFDSQALSRKPHNALSDASALKAYVLAEEINSYGRRPTRPNAEQPRDGGEIAWHAAALAGA